MQFEELHQKQSQWTVPDTELRESLRLAVAEVLLPAYRSFVKRFGSVFFYHTLFVLHLWIFGLGKYRYNPQFLPNDVILPWVLHYHITSSVFLQPMTQSSFVCKSCHKKKKKRVNLTQGYLNHRAGVFSDKVENIGDDCVIKSKTDVFIFLYFF